MPGEKYFLWNSIPNLLVIIGLIYYLYIRKSVGAVMAAMFVYLSLHGGYAIFAAATAHGIDTMNALHYQRSDLGVKLVGAGFLAYCSILLALRVHKPLVAVRGTSLYRRDVFFLLAFFLSCMVYGAFNLPASSLGKLPTVLKETIFSIGMWGGATVFAIALRQGSEYFISFRKEWLTAIFALSVLMVAAGTYEIVSGMVWAGTYYSTGFSYRASGTLFNPNVLGLWCAMTVLLGSLCFHLGWISRRATFGAMLLAMCILILSSSRSGFVLSIFNLGAVPLILFWRRKFIQKNRLDWIWPPAAFLLAFLLCLCLIEYAAPSRHAFMTTLYANLHRFLQLPEDVFWIFIMKVFTPGMKTLEPILLTAFEWVLAHLPRTSFTDNLGDSFPSVLGDFTKNIATAANSYEAGKVMESVNGRMLLEYISDNSFMSIYAVGGMWSLLIWLFLWAILFWTGIRNMQSRPGILSAHALAAVGFCFASGFFLRAPQLFPVWIFLSMVLGACLCWWSLAALPSSLTGAQSGSAPKSGQ